MTAMRTHPTRRTVLPLLAIPLVLSGCSSPAGDVVEIGGSGTSACMTLDAEAITMIIGVTNTGDEAVSLTSVSAQQKYDVTTDEAFIVPGFANDSGELEGLTVDDYPTDDIEGWPDRVPVDEAVLEPGADYSLVLPVLHQPDVAGYVSGLSLGYEDSGNGESRTATSTVTAGFGQSSAGACS